MPALTHNAYGKNDIRLTKVVREDGRHTLFEIVANVQVEGEFAAAYSAGNNRNVVATDTIKNFLYVKAKEHSFQSIEEFALILGHEYLEAYPQMNKVTVELSQSSWKRIEVEGRAHEHAFTDGGRQKRCVKVVRARGASASAFTGGIRDLLVLKTTASEWRGFHTDRHRTLKDTTDRIMATQVDAQWTFNTVSGDFDAFHAAISGAILSTFATQHSLGVQQTLQQMGEAALTACASIDSITLTLPNLHRIPFNLEPFGLQFENDIFVATDAPYGLISGTLTRGTT